MSTLRHRPSVTTYVAVVGAVALGGAYLDVRVSSPPVVGSRPVLFAVLAACCLVTELNPLRWLGYDDLGEFTGSWTFMMAMIMVGTPLAAVGASTALVVVAEVVARRAPIKVVFNVSQIVVSLTVGAATLHLFSQAEVLDHGGSPGLVWFPVAAAACVATFATNTVLTCTVIALHQKLAVRSVLREHGTDNLATDGMLLALSPIFVVAAERSLLLLPPLLVTTALVYRSAKMAVVRAHEATHDLLTDLPNRRLFDEQLDFTLRAAERDGERLGVVLIDLDKFKDINDGLGHHVGDYVLASVASRLTEASRPGDLLARLAGDEFAVILRHLPSVDAAAAVAQRILGIFDQPLITEGVPVVVRASAGVAVYPEHGTDPAVLLRRADEAMYAAKSDHSGTCVYRVDHDEISIGRLGLLADLARAVAADQLFLEYQPQITLSTGQVGGVEALVRWRHPTVGLVQPMAFMPLAEQTDLITPVTEWILRAALEQCAAWRSEGLDLRMAVNISVRNLQETDFPQRVDRALREAGVPAASLLLEITENTVALDRSTVRTVLHELRALGVALGIDDFGTGYSSIMQLRDLPVDQLKIDRGFVATMGRDTRNALIVRTILQLGAALGIQTVAEGVEEKLVASLLRDLGCDQAQGYLYARPIGAEDLSLWLESLDPWQPMTERDGAPRVQR